MIRLAHLDLPDGLAWVDELAAPVVGQSVRRRLDGGVSVFALAHDGGRPITLEAGADQWLTRAQAEGLAALAAMPGAVLTLTVRGTDYSVVFRHHEPPALDLRPLIDYADPAPDDPIVGHIRLLTV